LQGAVLINLRQRRTQPGVHTVFVGQKGTPMTPSGVDQMLYRMRDWAGIEDVPMAAHNLRAHSPSRTCS
jgi:hypothetical protein